LNRLKNVFSNLFLPLYIFLAYVFLYLPIFILIVFSFNKVAFPYRWVGFTFDWYSELFASHEIFDALKNSLIVASMSVFLSLSMSTLFIFYSSKWLSAPRLRSMFNIFYGSLLVPEIVLAVGLLSLFVFLSIPLGITTLIVGHTVIGLGYVIPILYTRFLEIDYSIVEASLDLGASLHQTFIHVIVPFMMPALVASGLLVFILSFDDFLIAFFCTGTTAQTLSLYIFSMIRTGISPEINALSTLMLGLSSLLVLILSSLKIKTRVI